jgi:hypothetical protein
MRSTIVAHAILGRNSCGIPAGAAVFRFQMRMILKTTRRQRQNLVFRGVRFSEDGPRIRSGIAKANSV